MRLLNVKRDQLLGLSIVIHRLVVSVQIIHQYGVARVSAGHPPSAKRSDSISSDCILFADSGDVFEFRLRPLMTEKMDF